MKIFYKAKLYPTESGLNIIFEKYYLIRETECFYMCVGEMAKWRIGRDDYPITNKQLKRIHKTSGRFAFDTKEKAIEHLRMLKRRQIDHMKREISFNERFLNCKTLPKEMGYGGISIPDSKGLVSKFMMFD